MKIKKHLIPAAIALLGAVLPASADVPAGYYSSLAGKKDGELKTAIYNRIHNFTRISSYNDLPRYFQVTDVYPQSSRWWDMYSDIPLYAPSFRGLNREHSFPKSWWGGSTTVSAYVDLNHLYPSEMKANTAKSNYPLGVVDTRNSMKFDNGVCKVGYPVNGQGGGAAFVFEPDDEYKGDFARTYFYMATCYQDLTWKYTFMVAQNTYPTLTPWAIDLLMKWHAQDPVSQKERDRNEAVYSIQNNRNPFIDCPVLADYLWGSKKGQPYDGSTGSGEVTPPATGTPDLVAPTRGMNLDFGQVALGQSAVTKLYIKGDNLRGKLSLTVYSGDRTYFTIPSSTLDGALANAEEGYWLNVTYRPTALGSHTSKLVISDGGITGSVSVTLRGECLPVPTLTGCTALPASSVESDRYLAEWTTPAGETVDYWIITRTKYLASGGVVTEEIPSEGSPQEITEFGESDRETYSVQSVRLGVRSPMSNVVSVDHAGIQGVETEEALVIQGFDGFMRVICSAPQQACEIFDPAGRLVMAVDEVEQNTDIPLPAGIYLVRTAQHRTPVKVAVR